MAAKIVDHNNIPRIIKELEYLMTHQVQIGVFGGEDSYERKIAEVHEFGCYIEPKNGKWLTIPTPAAEGKSPRDFPDKGPERLFRPNLGSGEYGRVLAQKDGKGFKIMFYLVDSVDIPERSFIRTTFDERRDKLEAMMVALLFDVLQGKKTGRWVLSYLGQRLTDWIRETMVDLKEPPNAPATRALKKGVDNPLIDTGRLRQSITWRVV